MHIYNKSLDRGALLKCTIPHEINNAPFARQFKAQYSSLCARSVGATYAIRCGGFSGHCQLMVGDKISAYAKQEVELEERVNK